MLGMPHLNKEEFQVLLHMTLQGERKFNLAIRLHGPPPVGKGVGAGLCVLGHAGPRLVRNDPISADSRKRF